MEATVFPLERASELDEELAVVDYDTRNNLALVELLHYPFDDLDEVQGSYDAVMPVEAALEHSGEGNWVINADEVELSTRVA